MSRSTFQVKGARNVPFFESSRARVRRWRRFACFKRGRGETARHSRAIDHSHDTIIVRPRNFDLGVVVPVGSLTPYIEEMTRFYIPELGRTSPGILWQPDPTFSPFAPGFPFEF